MSQTNKSYAQLIREAKSLYDHQQFQAAQSIFESIIEVFPDKAEPHFYYGACSLALEDNLKALGYFLKATSLEPNNAEYMAWTGKILQSLGHTYLAITKFKKALELDEHNLTALSDLGSLYTRKTLDSEAIVTLRKAISIKPSYTPNLDAISLSLARLGNYDEAIAHAKKAIRIEPKNAAHYFFLGNVFLIQGNLADAIQCYLKTTEIAPLAGEAFYSIAISKRISPEDKSIIHKMETALKKSMSIDQRKYFLFGLGKAYDDLKEHELAFSYIDKANLLIHSDYNPKSHTKYIKKLKRIYTKESIFNTSNTFSETHTPIFIVGMPRSGSTLIDQILATHTKVHSAGESSAIHDVIDEIRSQTINPADFPGCVTNFNKKEIEHYREIYLKQTCSDAGDATHIIDKNLFNYLELGLITTLFPNAKIIHTFRHPLDTCLSCYMTGFTFTESSWTHDLEYIGKYYRDYVDLINHWHKVLPVKILDVRYEDMVEDTETNTRRVLDFCDLEWEDTCLDFYKSKRGVNTASFWQVRQPIYKTAMQRWVPYAKHLQPLILALGDILEDDYGKIESLGLNHGPKHNSLQGKLSRLFSK